MRRKRLQRLVLAAAACGAAAVGSRLWWQVEFRGPPPAEEVLGWLPPDTETVIHAGGPCQLTELEGINEHSAEATCQALALLPLWVTSLRAPSCITHLQGRELSLCIEGCRNFFEPGPTCLAYEGATILVFRERLGQAGDAFMKAAEETALEMKDIEGRRVAAVPAEHLTRAGVVFVCLPARHVLIAATDETYLGEVLKRMPRLRRPPKLPEHLVEGWNRAGRASFWAVRRYVPSRAAQDPTTPLYPKGYDGMAVCDPQATGLVVALDFGPREVRVTHLSAHERAVEIATRRWKRWGNHGQATIREAGPGAVEAIFPITTGRAWGSLLEEVFEALGHRFPRA